MRSDGQNTFATISTRGHLAVFLDLLVGAGDQRRWYREPERLAVIRLITRSSGRHRHQREPTLLLSRQRLVLSAPPRARSSKSACISSLRLLGALVSACHFTPESARW